MDTFNRRDHNSIFEFNKIITIRGAHLFERFQITAHQIDASELDRFLTHPYNWDDCLL